MDEHKINIDGLDIFYKRKPARSDTKHLVVVFSWFSGDGKPTYNYENVLKTCPADILWIKDYFYGGESYYLCANGIMNIEKNIISFIYSVLKELGLEKCDCTFLGGSKGGSAALYYGLKYNIENILATVPQFYIGSYVEIDWPYAFKHIVGSLSLTEINKLKLKLDFLIEEQIKKSDKNKNIYLITSLADAQYKEQILGNIDKFNEYSNFNLIYANSTLITRHNQVNRHIIPVTTSILSLIAMGLPPSYAKKEIKYRNNENIDGFLEPFVSLRKFEVKDSRIFLEGISVIKGIPCPEYSDISIKLFLKSVDSSYEIDLAKGNVHDLGKKFISADSLISYNKGWFCTRGYNGLPIKDFPCGEWDVYIKINVKGITKLAKLISEEIIIVNEVGDGKQISFKANKNFSHIKIYELLK